jgi:predicted CXXCH cytochrome family protein
MRRLIFGTGIALIGLSILAISGIGAGLGLENQDAFCASCHTQPEAMYYQRSIQTKSADLAAFHTKKETHCIDCHSASGPFGRAHGLTQGAHDLVNFVRGSYHSPAVTTNPLGDDSCVKCHTKIYERAPGAGKAGLNHYHFYLLEWGAADPGAASCVSCHAPHTIASENLRFMNQGLVGKLCEDCHTALSGVTR